MSTITSVATAVPAFSATQEEVKTAFRPLFPLEERRLNAAMALFDHAEVQRRHSVLDLHAIAVPRNLTETMAVYAENARALGGRVARDCLRRAGVEPRAIDFVVTVSCTGVMIPSLDAYLMDELGMRPDVRRLPITELGCVGGAAALARTHDLLHGSGGARALVVSVELPSLSLQRRDVSPGNLVSSAIFGDGAAAALLESAAPEMPGARAAATAGTTLRTNPKSGHGNAAGATPPGSTVVSVLATLSHTPPATQHMLGFDLHEDGFHPVLAREVPALVRAAMGEATAALCARAGYSPRDLGAFVIHAGGKKILGAVEEALGLARDATQPSWDVLRDYGNQSSASVLFVLDRWMRTVRPSSGTLGVLAAFGPGLSTELLLLRWN